jgi:DedD protein
MEKKKILLVAVSVGVFLVIVLGAAILVFSPHNAVPVTSTAAASPIPAGAPVGTVPAETLTVLPSQPATVDPAGMVRNSDGIRSLQTPPEISAEPREDNFFVNSENERQSITVTAPALTESGGTGANTVINIPRPTTAAVPDTPPARGAAPRAASGTASRTASGGASSGAAAQPAARSSTPARSSTTTTPPAKAPAAPSAVNRDNFWVQTGSFSTKTRAEGAKDMLIAKGITPIIENRDVDGKTFFRVRVGPYTSKNEADYWLSLIKSINGFEDSQVWISQSRP